MKGQKYTQRAAFKDVSRHTFPAPVVGRRMCQKLPAVSSGQCKWLQQNVQMSASIVPCSDNAYPCAASGASLVMFTPLQTEMSVCLQDLEGKMSVWQDVGRSCLGREGVFCSRLSGVKASVSKCSGKEFRGKFCFFLKKSKKLLLHT